MIYIKEILFMSKTTLFDCKIKLIVDDLLKQVS